MDKVQAKLKIAMLGSCFSANVLLKGCELFSDWSIEARLSHVRTDAFLSHLKKEAFIGAPKSVVAKVISEFTHAAVRPRSIDYYKVPFLSQTSENINIFIESLSSADVLLLDNQYDLVRHAYKIRIDDGGNDLCFSSLRVKCENDNRITQLPLLSVDEMLETYSELFGFLRRQYPRLKVFLFQYPFSGLISSESKLDQDRMHRSVLMSQRLKDLSFDNVTVFPLVSIPEAEIGLKNRNHFSSSVYEVYAAAVSCVLNGADFDFSVDTEVPFSELKEFALVKQNTSEGSGFADLPTKISNPYRSLPERQFWKPSVADRFPLSISSLYQKKFPIEKSDKIATCGSCFAQHIGRRLKAHGFAFMDMEPPPANLPENQRVSQGYTIYSARYGNIYTAAQLLQLFERAFGEVLFDEAWRQAKTERFVDPFRPNLAGEGYETVEDMLKDQAAHLEQVQQMFRTLDVLVFTMGVTEYWYNQKTFAVYPIAPGVTAGEFDPVVHRFGNQDYAAIMADMERFIDKLHTVNPKCRLMLTVSPVPLTATAEERHVLISTMASKSILRAVADALSRRYEFIDYFPSYDIIMSPPFKGIFFQSNLRSIHEEGVDFVMSHFFAEHLPEANGVSACEIDNEELCDEIFLNLESKMVH